MPTPAANQTSSDPECDYVDFGRFPCPFRYRAVFGFSCVTLILTPAGDYLLTDPHRTTRAVMVDDDILESLSAWREFKVPLRQTGS